jgi:hypothetical protein
MEVREVAGGSHVLRGFLTDRLHVGSASTLKARSSRSGSLRDSPVRSPRPLVAMFRQQTPLCSGSHTRRTKATGY